MGNTRAHMKSLSLVTLCLVLSLAHAGYVEITSSTCAEQDKYLVCDDSDCYAAAAALGLGNGRKVQSSSLPLGCIANPDHNGNGPTYGFNRNGMSTEPCSTRDYNGNYNGSTSWSCLCRETACPVPSSQPSSQPSKRPASHPRVQPTYHSKPHVLTSRLYIRTTPAVARILLRPPRLPIRLPLVDLSLTPTKLRLAAPSL